MSKDSNHNFGHNLPTVAAKMTFILGSLPFHLGPTSATSYQPTCYLIGKFGFCNYIKNKKKKELKIQGNQEI
jgi:hypothetical protein